MKKTTINQILKQLHGYNQQQQYLGYEPQDIGQSLMIQNLGIDLDTVNQSAINWRILACFPKHYNPMAIALFCLTYLIRYQLSGQSDDWQSSKQLLELLLVIRSTGDYTGFAWGQHFSVAYQSVFIEHHTPDAITSGFVALAFLSAYQVSKDKKYWHIAKKIVRFLSKDLMPDNQLHYFAIKQSTTHPMANLVVARVLAQCYQVSQDSAYQQQAIALVDACFAQAQLWQVKELPNYQLGLGVFLLAEIMRDLATDLWFKDYQQGWAIYQKQFGEQGQAFWNQHRHYPYDIRNFAQGIITLSEADLSQAEKVADWAYQHFYNAKKGCFYYQKHPKLIKTCFLNWNHAWMAYALALLLQLKP